MPKLYSFSKMYHLTLATVLLLAVGALGTFWLLGEYKHHLDALESVQEEAIAERKTRVKALINDLVQSVEYQKDGVEEQLKDNLANYAEIGWVAANAIYQASRGHLADEKIKRLIIDTLMAMRFLNDRSYFWIYNTDYTLIATPYRQESMGKKSDVDLTDSKGQKIVRSFVDVARLDKKGGFVSYYWNGAGLADEYHTEKGRKKIAYLKFFEPYNWVIGIGAYLDDFEEQLQRDTVKRIAAIHAGTKGYIFTHTRDGVCLNHVKKENIGKNRWELLDAGGMKVVQALDRTGRQPGGGFLEYVGSIDPETGAPAKKISYVQSIQGWGWVVGSGVYYKDIQDKMLEYRRELFNALRNKIATTVIVLFSVLLVGLLIGHQLLKGFLKELNLFVTGGHDGEAAVIDLDKIRIKELRTIAEHANILLEEKEQARAELQSAKRMESIGMMAGGVAHDLNNILSGIVGYPEIVLQKLPPQSDLRDAIEAIRESGLRAATVVEDLLTVARGAACVREVHDLNILIGEYMSSPECKELRELYPFVQYDRQLAASPSLVSCSSVHVKKCLMNLVMNAAEAIAEGGVICVSTQNQTIEQRNASEENLAAGQYVVIVVQDSGPGISDRDIGHIFEPFYTKKEMGRSGTGLGLAVVWNTMADHDGKVTVQSSAQGTCFRLLFPLSDEKKVRSASVNETTETCKGHGERILVIDDEPSLRDLATQMLLNLGYAVDSVSSGEQAVAYLKQNQIQLILIDMLMEPGMNGRQTYEAILQLRPNQKAIIASGFSESSDVQEALRLGAGAFIKKPYSMEQLSRVVKATLAN